MIDIVINDCYTVKSLKNIFCKMKRKQKDIQRKKERKKMKILESKYIRAICLGAA